MSHRSGYHAMIDRGRKAGLTTREIYSALTTRPVEGSEQVPGQLDGNGIVSSVNPQGHRVSRPAASNGRT